MPTVFKITLTKHDKYAAERSRYITVLSPNNCKFVGDFVNRIYPVELEIKDTTDTTRPASYLDIHLEIDRNSSFLLNYIII
jgi:hypothetical protein